MGIEGSRDREELKRLKFELIERLTERGKQHHDWAEQGDDGGLGRTSEGREGTELEGKICHCDRRDNIAATSVSNRTTTIRLDPQQPPESRDSQINSDHVCDRERFETAIAHELTGNRRAIHKSQKDSRNNRSVIVANLDLLTEVCRHDI